MTASLSQSWRDLLCGSYTQVPPLLRRTQKQLSISLPVEPVHQRDAVCFSPVIRFSLWKRSPAYAGSHGCETVEECERVSSEALAKEDPLRRGVAEVNKGTTAVKPWGSTLGMLSGRLCGPRCPLRPMDDSDNVHLIGLDVIDDSVRTFQNFPYLREIDLRDDAARLGGN